MFVLTSYMSKLYIYIGVMEGFGGGGGVLLFFLSFFLFCFVCLFVGGECVCVQSVTVL